MVNRKEGGSGMKERMAGEMINMDFNNNIYTNMVH